MEDIEAARQQGFASGILSNPFVTAPALQRGYASMLPPMPGSFLPQTSAALPTVPYAPVVPYAMSPPATVQTPATYLTQPHLMDTPQPDTVRVVGDVYQGQPPALEEDILVTNNGEPVGEQYCSNPLEGALPEMY